MTHRLLLLCASATASLRRGRFPTRATGDGGDGLDARGRAAAHAARAHFVALAAGHGVAYSSPAVAARETAAVLGLAPRVETALRDTDYGRWSGRSLKDVARDESACLQAWLRNGAAPPGGESFAQVVARLAVWLETTLTDAVPPGVAAVSVAVTHPVVIRAAMLLSKHGPVDAVAKLDIAPLSVMMLERRDGAWTASSPPAHP